MRADESAIPTGWTSGRPNISQLSAAGRRRATNGTHPEPSHLLSQARRASDPGNLPSKAAPWLQTAPVPSAILIDRHLHKNGGSTMRQILTANERAGICQYWGYWQTQRGWDGVLLELKRGLLGPNSPPAKLPWLCVEVRPQRDAWLRRARGRVPSFPLPPPSPKPQLLSAASPSLPSARRCTPPRPPPTSCRPSSPPS